MTEQTRTALKELQNLDIRVHEARQRIRDFDPLFEEVEEPALVLESEVGNTRKRLLEMKTESRRLEISIEEKGTRLKRLEERLGGVRNLREEAAVTAELDMIKRALQSDEQESYTVGDQVQKLEDRLAELEAAWNEAKALVEPRKEELLAKREEAKAALAAMEKERAGFAESIDPGELRLYDGIRSGGRRLAVSELTEDGACGHCFGVVPLQLQNEIRHGTSLLRCEVCGVILAAPSPESEEAAPAKAPVAEAAVDEAPEIDEEADSGAEAPADETTEVVAEE